MADVGVELLTTIAIIDGAFTQDSVVIFEAMTATIETVALFLCDLLRSGFVLRIEGNDMVNQFIDVT